MYNECVCLRTCFSAQIFPLHFHCIMLHTSFNSQSEGNSGIFFLICLYTQISLTPLWSRQGNLIPIKTKYRINNSSATFEFPSISSSFFFVCCRAQTKKLRCDSNDDFFNINHFDTSSCFPFFATFDPNIWEKKTGGKLFFCCHGICS